MVDSFSAKVAKHWSAPPAAPARTRWWQSEAICRHINQNICGQSVSGTDGGDIALIKQLGRDQGSYRRAVSIGCGNAWHELQLLSSGAVDFFELYELAPPRREQAMATARARGLEGRISFPDSDPFADTNDRFDLVYWKDALHHMPNARAAVSWSRASLKPGGLFYMNEFVGPTYMQYTTRQFDLAERARSVLAEQYLRNPRSPQTLLPLRREPVSVTRLLEIDPSECQDSGNILPAFREAFPNGTVIPTGGVVYSLAMSDALANFDEKRDASLIAAMLWADDLCTELGEYLYAVAWAKT